MHQMFYAQQYCDSIEVQKNVFLRYDLDCMINNIIHTIDDIPLKEYRYETKFLSEVPLDNIFFVADIGGTNSNFGICALFNKKLFLCNSFHAPSQKIADYTRFIQLLLEHIATSHHREVRYGCIGAAGALMQERTWVKPTNLSTTIDTQAIQHATNLQELFLINDFEAVGLGIPYLEPDAIVTIRKGMPQPKSQQAAIGAGTGLGKVALLWDHDKHMYIPLSSEGGHADCSAQTETETSLFKFIQDEQKTNCPVSWETVLSGNGLSRIYRFLGTHKNYQSTTIANEIQETGFKPDRISHYAQQDQQCHDTFKFYKTFYARCAKNFALDALSLNGMYIAGGIAAHNINLFKEPEFYEEFTRCGKQKELLSNMPLYVIVDYNISLYGAAAYILFQRGLHT